MSVRKFCCLIGLLINLSCTVYMKTTSNFVCTDDTDNAAVTRHDKMFAKAAKVHRTPGPLRDLVKNNGHQRIAATNEPPATTKDATTTNHTTTTTAVTTELATTKAPSANPPSTTTTLAPTTKATTHTPTSTKTSPAFTKTISAPVITQNSIKDNKKRLGIFSTATKATKSITQFSKALFSNGKWKLPEVDPPGTWLI